MNYFCKDFGNGLSNVIKIQKRSDEKRERKAI